MALWDKLGSRGSVDDRRGRPSALAVGGGGITLTGLALLLLVNYLGGGSIGDVVSQINTTQVPQYQGDTSGFEGQDSYEVFASTVLGSTNDMWKKIFAAENRTFTEPTLVLFRNGTESACGGAQTAVGPHYCPLDKKIYLDETFFDEMQSRLGAGNADVAQAYVIAHEAGHHAQNELGILDDGSGGDAQAISIKQELQADCFAGLWAYSIKDRGVLAFDEIQEALDAAAAVGDDRIQKETTGEVNPETWTHGSSAERVSWFNRGYTTGDIQHCNP